MHPELHKKLMTEAEIESTFGLKTLCSFAHITHFQIAFPSSICKCFSLSYIHELLEYGFLILSVVSFLNQKPVHKSPEKKVTVLSALAWKLSFSTICRINYHLFLLSHIVSLTLLPCIEVCTQCL